MAATTGGTAEQIDAQRQPTQRMGLVVKEKQDAFDRTIWLHDAPGPAAGKFPRRPDPTILSESIPLYFIGRNKAGFWVAREAEARAGGIFLFKHSALRFATKRGAPAGCATMLLRERFELDVENRGNPLVAWLDAAVRRVAKLIPEYPPPMPIRRRIFRAERR
jgi:hypothetical protein